MPMAVEAFAARVSTVQLGAQMVTCRLLPSKAAKRLRIRVHPEGVDVVVPSGRDAAEAMEFVRNNESWVVEQLVRAKRLAALRAPVQRRNGKVMLHGEIVPVDVSRSAQWRAPARVTLQDGRITITCAPGTRTPARKSLENWMRKRAREAIEPQVQRLTKRLGRAPHGIYVMSQRTKWGNCSAMGNLSFNWRLIMAPEYVLRYIVTHEMAHLAVPDHSPKFWLTVQSHCPETERARQWLVSNGRRLMADLPEY